MVRGEVQGVGFRYFVLAEGRRLGLRGWVRNNADGTVEIVAEGSRAELEQLRIMAGRGPRHARVDQVDAEWTVASGGLGEFELAG